MLKITKTLFKNVAVKNILLPSALPLARSYAGKADAAAAPSTDVDEPIDIPNPFAKEQRKCILCQLNITPSYKNVKLLSQFQSPYTGRIYGRHITGLCTKRQEQVENAIIRAQNCAMMPTYHKHVDFLNDPKLFDPERPIRPHKY